MRWLSSLSAIILAMVVAAPLAQAQRNDIFVTPIPNSPFTGIVNVARTQVRQDGTLAQMKTIRDIGRDSHGRIFNQMKTLVPVDSQEMPQRIGVHIYDPQTRVSTIVNDQQHTFQSMTVNRPPEMVPPSFLSASSGLNTLPQNQFTKEEDLGNKVIDGIAVHGVRQSQTIPAENGGKGITITDEYWYSEDLRINLVLKHDDPRTGGVTMTVTNIQRSEPDPSRFDVPAGYTRPVMQPPPPKPEKAAQE